MSSPSPRVLPMGELALLVELADTDAVLALAAALRDVAPITELVPAARTLLVKVADPSDLPGAREAVAGARHTSTAGTTEGGEEHRIQVVYDGPDLAEVADLTGLSPQEVVAAHTGMPWRVGFIGFAPGFAYLVGGDPRLDVPRRATPRTSVPVGAVGLAGSLSGIYPRSSPGGWQLIGRTDALLWDVDRRPPALLRPGDVVRFEEVSEVRQQVAEVRGRPQAAPGGPADDHKRRSVGLRATTSDARSRGEALSGRREAALEVLAVGPLVLVQDLGRPGLAEVGVGRSGAADRGALALGNRLLGQAEATAGLEVTLGGLQVRARGDLTVCLTGAPCPADVDGRGVGHAAPVALRDGQVLTLGIPDAGLRTCLTVRGGIGVEPVLGSRSRDVLAGLGPEPLEVGQVVPVGDPPAEHPIVDQAAPPAPTAGLAELTITPGPRADWIEDLDALTTLDWQASSDLDRVGVRLVPDPATTGERPPLRRAAAYLDTELPSEPMVRGAIQLPPDGRPVIFLADHPVTGGYPVVAIVTSADVDRAAQLRPGQPVRLRLRRA